ncbi:hypothetical protein BDN70DRAFT_196981 [Pholiota conissans]|uniref:Uncharacterized protein n=1 Tax=Pholiota conissans TaxID=109636 RepID=A0A9P6D5Y2_9AGAR|nr:hypothetical protein BDN70DRAFT_196981 [Pholiota conissans]
MSILNGVDRHNYYFEKLQYDYRYSNHYSIFTFLVHGCEYKFNRFNFSSKPLSDFVKQHRTLFHLDQLCFFLDKLLEWRSSTTLQRYQGEMKMRIMHYLFQNDVRSLTSLDAIFTATIYGPIVTISSLNIDYILDQQSAHLLRTIFKNVIASQVKKEESRNPLYSHNVVLVILQTLADGIVLYSQASARSHSDESSSLPDIGEEYSLTFRSISEHLDDEITSSSESSPTSPSLVFYLSADFLMSVFQKLYLKNSCIPPHNTNFTRGFVMLLDSMATYKSHISNRRNEAIEKSLYDSVLLFGGPDYKTYRFSETWWRELFRNYDASSLRDISKGPAWSSRAALDIALDPQAPSDPSDAPNIQ